MNTQDEQRETQHGSSSKPTYFVSTWSETHSRSFWIAPSLRKGRVANEGMQHINCSLVWVVLSPGQSLISMHSDDSTNQVEVGPATHPSVHPRVVVRKGRFWVHARTLSVSWCSQSSPANVGRQRGRMRLSQFLCYCGHGFLVGGCGVEFCPSQFPLLQFAHIDLGVVLMRGGRGDKTTSRCANEIPMDAKTAAADATSWQGSDCRNNER